MNLYNKSIDLNNKQLVVISIGYLLLKIMKNRSIIIFLAATLLSLVSSRIYQTSFLFNQFQNKQGFIFLDKMVFSPGMCSVQFETRTSGMSLGGLGSNSAVFLEVIPQQKWAYIQKQKCNSRQFGTRTFHRISPPSKQSPQKMTDNSTIIIDVDEQKMFYFVLKDCGKHLQADYNNSQLTLFLRLTMNNNGKQMGEEQDHWYVIPIIIGAGLWLIFFNKQALLLNGQQQWAKKLVFMGIAANISSLTWKTFGYIIYAVSGFDYIFFHIIYLFMHAVSQSFVIGLLVLIAFGWSINYMKGKQFDLYLPLMVLVAALNIIMTVLTKINHRSHDRHHIFDSIPGMLLIYYRLVILLIFVGAVIYTYKQSRHKVKQFIIKFSIFGFVYIAALPLILMWANTNIQAKNRNQFVFVTVQIVKTICNITLTYIIGFKRSQYQKVSYSNNSFIPEQSAAFK